MRILRLVIQCKTPLHCGGGEDSVQDQPVTRDAFNYWRIPGSSLAGSLRSLADGIDPASAKKMFGWQEQEKSHASLIWAADGLLLDYDNRPVLAKMLAGETPKMAFVPDTAFVRDHVRLDLERGAAVEAGKFDAEIVPAGARFLLEFRCDGWDTPLTGEEKKFFDNLCLLVLAGKMPIGGKTGLGYGLYEPIAWDLCDIDLEDSAGMEQWLNYDCFAVPAGSKGQPGGALPEKAEGLDGWLELPLSCDAPILIGGGKSDDPEGRGEADIMFAKTPWLDYVRRELSWRPVLPASSIKGVLRHAIYHVLTGLSAPDPEAILKSIFGLAEEGEAACGRLVVTDCLLESPKPNFTTIQHVAIDRFDGGALDGALFNERPYWQKGTKALLRIRANKLDSHEAALLFHALFDLFAGDLAMGSGGNRGNGRLYLKDWEKTPAEAACAIAGDITWRGRRLFQDGLAVFSEIAPEWDKALREKVGA